MRSAQAAHVCTGPGWSVTDGRRRCTRGDVTPASSAVSVAALRMSTTCFAELRTHTVRLFRPYDRRERTDAAGSDPKPRGDVVVRQQRGGDQRGGDQRGSDQRGSDQRESEHRRAERVPGPVKKGRPTPTRREAEAARRERLNPTPTKKEQKTASRQAARARRAESFQRADNTPEKTLLRDFIDSRWHVTEFLMPALILLMALTFVTAYFPRAIVYVTVLTWGLMLLAILDMVLTWRRFKRLLAQRLPRASTRNLLFYAINRLIQIRRFRVPGPRVNRGATI